MIALNEVLLQNPIAVKNTQWKCVSCIYMLVLSMDTSSFVINVQEMKLALILGCICPELQWYHEGAQDSTVSGQALLRVSWCFQGVYVCVKFVHMIVPVIVLSVHMIANKDPTPIGLSPCIRLYRAFLGQSPC